MRNKNERGSQLHSITTRSMHSEHKSVNPLEKCNKSKWASREEVLEKRKNNGQGITAQTIWEGEVWWDQRCRRSLHLCCAIWGLRRASVLLFVREQVASIGRNWGWEQKIHNPNSKRTGGAGGAPLEEEKRSGRARNDDGRVFCATQFHTRIVVGGNW